MAHSLSTPWMKVRQGQACCLSCDKKISTKPGEVCREPRHLKCYRRNVNQINARRKDCQVTAFVYYSGYYPPQCVICGYSNILALQLDHIDGNGAEFRRRNPNLTGKALAEHLCANNFPDGYRVLCANCQCLERERLGCNGGGGVKGATRTTRNMGKEVEWHIV